MHHSDWWNAFQSRKSLQRPLGTGLSYIIEFVVIFVVVTPEALTGTFEQLLCGSPGSLPRRINKQDRGYGDRHDELTSQLLDVSASVSPLFPLGRFCLMCVLSSLMSVAPSAFTVKRSKRTKSQCADRSGSECVSVGICISGAWLTCKSFASYTAAWPVSFEMYLIEENNQTYVCWDK